MTLRTMLPLLLLLAAAPAQAQMPAADARTDSTKWEYSMRSLWPEFSTSEWRIDACARPLALDLRLDTDANWPSFCNYFRATEVVAARVAVLRAALDSLHLAPEQIAQLHESRLWPGAPVQALLILWGTPYQRQPAGGGKETWLFDHGAVDVAAGRVVEVRGAPHPGWSW